MKVSSYGRISPRPQENESIDTQFASIRTWAEAEGYEVVGEYGDSMKSGKNMDRAGLTEALEEVAANRKAGILAVYSMSRLSRNLSDSQHLLEQIGESGGRVYDVSAGRYPDITSPDGWLAFVVAAAVDQYQRWKGAQTTQSHMLRLQGRGQRMSARLPYGKRIDPERDETKISFDGRRELPVWMSDDPVEQRIIGIMLRLQGRGWGDHRITGWLNKRGVVCRGGKWHRSTVRRILDRCLLYTSPSPRD